MKKHLMGSEASISTRVGGDDIPLGETISGLYIFGIVKHITQASTQAEGICEKQVENAKESGFWVTSQVFLQKFLQTHSPLANTTYKQGVTGLEKRYHPTYNNRISTAGFSFLARGGLNCSWA